MPANNKDVQNRQLKREEKHRSWRDFEERLEARNATEFIYFSLLYGLAVFGFIAVVGLFFEQVRPGFSALAYCLFSGAIITGSANYGIKIRRQG